MRYKGKHLIYPLQKSRDGQFLITEEDSKADIESQAILISQTLRGERPLVRDLGVEMYAGGQVAPVEHVQAEIDRHVGSGKATVTLSYDSDGVAYHHIKAT